VAKLVDPDDLTLNSEIFIDTSTKLITLSGQGLLDYEDGVTGQCVYSFLKEQWRTNPALIKFPFPMIAITEEQFELIESWNWQTGDQKTRNTIRDAGWALKSGAGVTEESYMNLTTLGSFYDSANDKAYYVQVDGTPVSAATPDETVFAGPVNQAIKIYGDVTHGNFDYTDNFVIWLREEQDTYDYYDLLTEQNLTTLTYKKYALPLSSVSDLVKADKTDAEIEADPSTYRDIVIKYYVTPQLETGFNSGSAYFHIYIDANGKTLEQVYQKVQYQLRSADNINENPATSAAYPIRGDIAGELVEFVGDTLKTKHVAGWGGVFIDNVLAADVNDVEFTDDTNSGYVTYPYTASGVLNFNQNLLDDNDALYWMFFTTVGTPASAFGTEDAVLVEDSTSSPISGSVNDADGDGNIDYTFDYDGNTQAGRTAGTNADVTVVAIGLSTAQYVSTTAEITRSKANNISLVASLERNYSNP
jgi:hypothetical protein